MSEPLISIVTVTKNCAATLGRTLSSVRAAKVADIEYILVDGVSSDGTLEVIAQFDGLVDRLISEPDSGIYEAMNKGALVARGAYIVFINGDDELVPDGMDAVRRVLRTENPDVACATTLVSSATMPQDTLVARPWCLLFFNSIPHPSSFVRTSLMRQYRFREDLRIAADYDLFLRLFMDKRRFVSVDAVSALHHRGGASGDSVLSAAEVERIKRERLGWRYSLIAAVQAVHRWRKEFFAASAHGK